MTPWEEILERASAPLPTVWEHLLGDLLSSAILTPGMRGRDDLRIYQHRTVGLIKAIWEPGGPPGVIVALEPGAGKTVSTLTALRDLLDEGKIKRVLLVAPLLVAETVWHQEIEEWAHLTGTTYVHLTGNLKKRSAAFESNAEIHIINKELVPWLWEFAKDRWKYDCLVIDEASMLKNGKKRTPNRKLTRFGALAQARKHFSGVIELTGTPAPNGVKNLWGLSYIIDQGERLGRTKNAFNERWIDFNKYTYEEKPKPGAEEQILGNIKDIMFSLDPKDYVELPPLVENDIKVALPPKIMEEYKRFKRTLVSEAYDVEAVNAAVLTNKLLQFCISKDTEVLTRRGWVPIQQVEKSDVVWDGEEWVNQKGSIYKGKKPVVACYGVNMTIDHKVLTVEGWREANEVIYGNASLRLDRAPVRLPDGLVETWNDRGQNEEGNLDVSVRLWEARRSDQPRFAIGRETPSQRDAELRLQARGDGEGCDRRTRHDRGAPVGDLAGPAPQMPKSRQQGLQELRRPWNRYARLMVRFLRGVLGGREERICGRPHIGSTRQRQGLFQSELPMGLGQGSVAKYASESDHRHPMGRDDSCGSRRSSGAELRHSLATLSHPRVAGSEAVRTTGEVEVYDLIDCGPRNRFVVRGADGPVIVHNCNGSMYQEDGNDIWVHDCKLSALVDLHEECNGTPLLVAYTFKFDLNRIKKKFPKAIVLNEQKDVQKTIRDWNDGAIDILLAHPASAGHGLNLQRGSNISVWYGLTADLELFQQFNKRLWRSGQQARAVFSHRIIATATHDEEILPILNDKDAVQSRVLRATQISLLEG